MGTTVRDGIRRSGARKTLPIHVSFEMPERLAMSGLNQAIRTEPDVPFANSLSSSAEILPISAANLSVIAAYEKYFSCAWRSPSGMRGIPASLTGQLVSGPE
jgi:hypothetical protein